MARSPRLLDLVQILRRHRRTVSGETLARELGVSLRTIRRDVATLQTMGADIAGEAGVGYTLRPGFLLPPLAFTEEEVRALMLGAQWVSRQADERLARAVGDALAKIEAVLPADLRRTLADDSVYVGGRQAMPAPVDFGELRRAMREQRKLAITLPPPLSELGEQIVWPIKLAFIDAQRHLAAWCEADDQFRIIALNDVITARVLADRYPRSRRRLVEEWQAGQNLPCTSSGARC